MYAIMCKNVGALFYLQFVVQMLSLQEIGLYMMVHWCLLTPFFVRDDDRSGLIGEGKVTVYFDSRWKPACKDGCR